MPNILTTLTVKNLSSVVLDDICAAAGTVSQRHAEYCRYLRDSEPGDPAIDLSLRLLNESLDWLDHLMKAHR